MPPDILDDANWQPEQKAAEAEAVYDFICRYTEIHHKPPSLSHICDGTMLNSYRANKAISRLRMQKRLSKTSHRLAQKRTTPRKPWAKGGGDAAD